MILPTFEYEDITGKRSNDGNSIDDIPAHTKKVEALGGKVLIPETEAPGQGHFAWLADPEGNLFALWKPLAG